MWYLLNNGCSWRALPDQFGKWHTVFQYFNRLSKSGFFDWLHAKLVSGNLEEVAFADSTHCKVHQHAYGKQSPEAEGIGSSRGGPNTKIHAVCDALLRLCAPLMLTAGNVSDHTAAPQMLASITDQFVVADKGYDSRALREQLCSQKCEPCIPYRKNTKQPQAYNEFLYRARHCVENLFQRMKVFRRVATRFEKTSRMFLAMVLVSLSALYEKRGLWQ